MITVILQTFGVLILCAVIVCSVIFVGNRVDRRRCLACGKKKHFDEYDSEPDVCDDCVMHRATD